MSNLISITTQKIKQLFAKTHVWTLLLIVGLILIAPISVSAQNCPSGYQCEGGCEYIGHCVSNRTCILVPPFYIRPGARNCGSFIIGRVNPPQGVADYNMQTALQPGSGNIGILLFVSNVVKLITAVGGILILINFVVAGITLIAQAGNTQAMTGVKDKLTYGLIGLVIMVAAYTAMALVGQIIFGNPLFIINPDLNALGALSGP